MRGEGARRRGQITMFVIIGLLILLVFGIFYLLFGAQQTSDGLRDRVQGTVALSDMALIDRHVGSCLDAIVKDELRILGDTGAADGVGPSAIVGTGATQTRVAYGITRNAAPQNTDVLPIANAAPRYPEWNVTIAQSTHDPRSGRPFPAYSGGYFGDVQFAAACDREGPNGPGAFIACVSYPDNPPGTRGPSVQETLSRNIVQRVASCASPSVFSQAIGRDVARVGDATLNVTYLPSEIAVTLTYPLVLSGDIVLETQPISRSYDVRLLSLLRFADDLARAESRNVTFRIEQDYSHLISWKQGMTVRRSRDVPVSSILPGGSITPRADMVVILDAQSDLGSGAFPFRFLVEHRLPMLDTLPDDDWVSIFVSGEDPVAPVAADPDDGPLLYDDPHITKEIDPPANQSILLQVVVWDADCPTPYSSTTCRDYDHVTIRRPVSS